MELFAALGGALIGGLMALLGNILSTKHKSRREDFEILRTKIESTHDLLDEYGEWIALYQSHVLDHGEDYRPSPINKLVFLVRLYFSALSEYSDKLLSAHKLYEERYFDVMRAKIENEDSRDIIEPFLKARQLLQEAEQTLRKELLDEGSKLLSEIRAG